MGRVLTFADPEVIKLAQEKFIPVATDDWYTRRRKDAEGAFFRLVSDQSPRKASGESGTRQGIYTFTASGKLLSFRNHHDPAVMKAELRKALAAWEKLPAREREPGAVKVDDPEKVDAAYNRKPPKGTLIVNVFTRILDKDDKGEYCHGTCEFTGGDRAAHDRLWLTQEEWQSLIPISPKVGQKAPIADRLVKRIARFHLVDNTRGEPPHWHHKDIKKAEMTLEVVAATDDKVEMRVTGTFLLTTGPGTKGERGFDLNVLGTITVDRKTNRIERFDLVGLGDHWGSGPLTRNARPGRMPLGLAFELSSGDTPSDQVPPQGARWLQGYLQAEKAW